MDALKTKKTAMRLFNGFWLGETLKKLRVQALQKALKTLRPQSPQEDYEFLDPIEVFEFFPPEECLADKDHLISPEIFSHHHLQTKSIRAKSSERKRPQHFEEDDYEFLNVEISQFDPFYQLQEA